MSRITKLTITDFKRISAVEMTPDGGTVMVAGNNGQGKSSVLDAIQAALQGRNSIPADPVRHGARRAVVELEMGDLKVVRTFSPKGSRLEVSGKNGKLKSPQAVLDALTKSLTFDPIAFERQPPKVQTETLREMAGLDTSAEEAELARVFAVRADVNRDVKRLDAIAGGPKPHDGAGSTETSTVARMEALEAGAEKHRGLDRLKRSALLADDDLKSTESRAENIKVAMETYRLELVEMDAATKRKAAELKETRALIRSEASKLPDLDALKAAVQTAEQDNAKARANAEHERQSAMLRTEEAKSGKLTDRVDGIRSDIAAKIEAASFPVPGLAISDDGVEFDGVPFAQASGAERLRVSAAIGLALNPELRILLIRDGSLMDDKSMAVLSSFAEDNDCQCWVEVVGDREGAAIVLEDGHAKE